MKLYSCNVKQLNADVRTVTDLLSASMEFALKVAPHDSKTCRPKCNITAIKPAVWAFVAFQAIQRVGIGIIELFQEGHTNRMYLRQNMTHESEEIKAKNIITRTLSH